MTRNSLLAITALMLTSCASFKENRRIQKCAKFSCVQEVKTIIKDSVVFKDTTVYITQKGKTEYINNPCAELCDSFGNLKPFLRENTTNGVRTVIKTVNNTLVVECETDSLEAIITGLKETYHSEVIQEVVEIERQKTLFDKIQSWYFWLSLLTVGLFLVYKYYRGRFKFFS